ncbi:MAG: hypothetical protein DSZ21_01775 [Tenericutes bacterium]|nr:MAG: hypothetical protein DSZ21_01775 [Mycoplasmatota bacterium]
MDAYTGEKISKEEVIKYPGNFDIDHIIPRSQSFDNSRNNKVLTRSGVNSEKKNNTPYQFLSEKDFSKMEKL